MSLSAANAQFALNLYHQLSQKDGNLFLSPLSISIAMAMTYLGARGTTQAQMKSGLCFDGFNDETLLHQSFSKILSSLKDTDGKVILHLANRLFAEKSYNFLQEYTTASLKHYGAELAPLDFSHKAAECATIINKWVSEQTHEKIQNLISSDNVGPTTKLILVNAIYFKGDWKTQFDRAVTHENEEFHVTKDQTVTVPMMYMKDMKVDYAIHEVLGCQAIRLPYVGDQLSMIVLLPDESKTNLQEIESKLTPEHLLELKDNMLNQKVNVWLPRFKLDARLSLKDTLSALGLSEAFSEGQADFSGMDGSNKLYISDAIHQAAIEVNEEGSEAAAATAVMMFARCAMIPMPAPEFKANHPFLFFIQDNSSGSILFLGRLMNP